MTSSRTSNLLFASAFVVALAARLIQLGNIPLGDGEAHLALQSFNIARGLRPEIGSHTAYVMFTALVFYLVQASDFAARLFPALMGALLTLVPLFFRDRLGSKPAVILSFALALEPGLLGLSRQAGSAIPALAAVFAAWGLWRSGKTAAAGMFAGLALLTGPALWPGLLGLGLAFGLSRAFSEEISLPSIDRARLKTGLAYAVGTYVAFASIFLLQPTGLGAGLGSLPDYLRGWLNPSDVSPLRLALTLAFYQPIAIIFAIIGLVRGIRARQAHTLFAASWLGVALVLAFAYPGRQTADLAWALIPLWVLAALALADTLTSFAESKWEVVGMTTLTFAILIFVWINFIAIAAAPIDPATISLRWGVIAGSLGLLVLSAVLVGLGWSTQTALRGGLWGLGAAMLLYTFSLSATAGGLRATPAADTWRPAPAAVESQALAAQVDTLSLWHTGIKNGLHITISEINSASLQWALRESNATLNPAETMPGAPDLVITPLQQSTPQLQAAYRGQEFTWRTSPAWEQATFADWMRWIVLREIPSVRETIILWARTDIFPDTQNLTNP